MVMVVKICYLDIIVDNVMYINRMQQLLGAMQYVDPPMKYVICLLIPLMILDELPYL